MMSLLARFGLLSAVFATTAESIDVFVSPSGSDADDGSFARPFQTLSRAQVEVQALKALNAAAPMPINVVLRGGRYELQQTLEFTSLDGGPSWDAPVTYQAYCDPAVEQSLISQQSYPYQTHLPTPPRQLWNGNGDKSLWTGPMDPFLEVNINVTSNSLLPTPLPPPAPIPVMDIGDVCVDKVVSGSKGGPGGSGAHTCYAGAIATCVSGCMTACALHVERKTYSASFYRKFSHLFGKQLVNEEDCVEICSLSCRGCEQTTISGAKRIGAGQITTWALHNTLTDADSRSLPIYKANLSSFLPHGPVDADNPTVFSTLFVNDVQLPRAGFPDCTVVSRPSDTLSEFSCTYSAPVVSTRKQALTYDLATFSPRVTQWSKVDLAEVEYLANISSSPENLRYRVKRVDAASKEIALGAGGSQLTLEAFERGLDLSSSSKAQAARFRVENLLEELDSPGEWYFDPATKLLYLMPLDPASTLADMSTVTLEIPLLRQLVRISGTRENHYTAAAHASSSLVEMDSNVHVANLILRQLHFSGSQLLTGDVYERIPGVAEPSWPMVRVGAIFLESATNITVEHCSFIKIGGNAMVVSGESDFVQLRHNNISYVGSSGIAILARVVHQVNSRGDPVLAHTLFSRFANVSFNQVHHIGRRLAHSSAVMVVGATQTVVQGNLIYAFPSPTGRNYWITNADGSSPPPYSTPALVRGLDSVVTIPRTLADNLSTAYTILVPVQSPGFDVPVIAKLIGAPECPSGSGRIGSLFGEQLPFSYTQCSGCCSLHANSAKIRVAGSNVAWADAVNREVVLRPGETVELQAPSSAFFNSITDVYLGFHVITPNQILELPSVRAKWQIVTRKCRYTEATYRAECHGPCASSVASPEARGCGNSNIAIQESLEAALQCDVNYEPDINSLACAGPFEAIADCDGSGIPRSHLYYNCSMSCFSTACV